MLTKILEFIILFDSRMHFLQDKVSFKILLIKIFAKKSMFFNRINEILLKNICKISLISSLKLI